MIDIETVAEGDDLPDIMDTVVGITTDGVMELMAEQYAMMSDDEVVEFHRTIEHCIVLCVKRRIEVQNADG